MVHAAKRKDGDRPSRCRACVYNTKSIENSFRPWNLKRPANISGVCIVVPRLDLWRVPTDVCLTIIGAPLCRKRRRVFWHLLSDNLTYTRVFEKKLLCTYIMANYMLKTAAESWCRTSFQVIGRLKGRQSNLDEWISNWERGSCGSPQLCPSGLFRWTNAMLRMTFFSFDMSTNNALHI